MTSFSEFFTLDLYPLHINVIMVVTGCWDVIMLMLGCWIDKDYEHEEARDLVGLKY